MPKLVNKNTKQLRFEDVTLSNGRDEWVGNCYRHMNHLWGVQVLPSKIKGEYYVRHVMVISETDLNDNG